MRWTTAELRAYEQRRQAGNPGQAPKLESDSRDEPLAAKEVQRRTGEKLSVRITSFRKRLIDPDNLCEKFHLDLCRYAGAIPDDAPDCITLETRQEKAKFERVEIDISDANPPNVR
jgi:hypothetical protein